MLLLTVIGADQAAPFHTDEVTGPGVGQPSMGKLLPMRRQLVADAHDRTRSNRSIDAGTVAGVDQVLPFHHDEVEPRIWRHPDGDARRGAGSDRVGVVGRWRHDGDAARADVQVDRTRRDQAVIDPAARHATQPVDLDRERRAASSPSRSGGARTARRAPSCATRWRRRRRGRAGDVVEGDAVG